MIAASRSWPGHVRDAGMEVIYTGLWQTPEAVVRAVEDEDADVVGISLLSGAHQTLVPVLIDALKARGLGHVLMIVGGIIPAADIPRLIEMGVGKVFTPGAGLTEIADFIRGRGTEAGRVGRPLEAARIGAITAPRMPGDSDGQACVTLVSSTLNSASACNAADGFPSAINVGRAALAGANSGLARPGLFRSRTGGARRPADRIPCDSTAGLV